MNMWMMIGVAVVVLAVAGAGIWFMMSSSGSDADFTVTKKNRVSAAHLSYAQNPDYLSKSVVKDLAACKAKCKSNAACNSAELWSNSTCILYSTTAPTLTSSEASTAIVRKPKSTNADDA